MSGELLFVGGRVFTADPRRPYAQAVSVRDGRIAAVGAAATLLRSRGPRTEVVDLEGGLLLPGFVDAHVHPVMAGMERMRCDLSELHGADAYLARVASYAASHPGLEWVEGGGWSLAAFPGGTPLRSQLDGVCPSRPVFLINSDHHGAWVNSRALELAGIDARTPDPADGRIERDASGAPTGLLHEGAMDLVGRLLPRASRAEYVAALLDAQRALFAVGVVGWQDAIVGAYAGYDDQLEVYLDVAASGALRARVTAALWWDRTLGAEQIESLVARRERVAAAGHGRFQARTVKVMQDGIAENFTAGMTSPYLDSAGCACGGRGLSYVDPALLASHVTELDRLGFQVHFHAIGDRAVRECLDAVAAARTANGANDHRHHIAHVQVVDPADVPRFAELDVAANLQTLWAAHSRQMDELNIPFLGAERAAWQYPFADLLRTGARLCSGSDWPISSPDPLQAIHTAVNRTDPAPEPDWPPSKHPFLPTQKLTLAEALHSYTAGSAWTTHQNQSGVIQKGHKADLTILDRDPFTLPPEQIATTKTRLTFIDGQIVHESH